MSVSITILGCGSSGVTNVGCDSAAIIGSNDYIFRAESGQFISRWELTQTGFVSGLPLNINSSYQNFNPPFFSIPRVFCQIEVSGSNPQYSVNTKDITTSGFIALFSNFIGESGVKLHTFAKI